MRSRRYCRAMRQASPHQSDPKLPFERLVFGGGGARCFWEAGVAEVLNDHAQLELDRVSAVSGGSVVAAAFLAAKLPDLLDAMREQFSRIDHNVRWRAISKNKSLFPHCQAYHRAIEQTFDDAALERIEHGPDFWVQLTRRPPGWPQRVAIAVASTAHESERIVRGTPHGNWLRMLGFSAEFVDAKTTRSGSELADLLIASGCVPPLIPLQQWDGSASLDGSLIDNAPIGPRRGGKAEVPKTLVLVTRRYPNLPSVEGRTYLRPSKDMPASKLDFSDADAVAAAYRLGRKDGEAFVLSCR